jgi:hypothetical protein
MKVLKVTHSRLQVERIFPELYQEIHDEFLQHDGFQLPTYGAIKKNYQYPDDVRVLLKDLKIQIETDTEIIDVLLKRGMLTDFGSVPKKARSIVPYDDIKYIIAYLTHDGWFGANKGFTFGNNLLREMLRYKGVAWRKLQYVFYPVQWFGKKAYKKSQYQKARERQFIEITRTDKK